MTSRKQEIIDEKYTWSYKLRYTFYATLLSLATLTLYGIFLDLCVNSTISKSSIFAVYKENFHFTNFNLTSKIFQVKTLEMA